MVTKKISRFVTGKFGALVASGVAAACLWVGLGGSVGAAPPPPDPETCLPSCVVNDGRFLVVAGADPTTLSSQKIVVGLRFTEFSGDGNFGLFDADRNAANWDVPFEDGIPGPNPDAPKITIQVFVDPNGVGGEGTPVASFTPGAPIGGIENGAWEDLPFGGPVNNAWTDLQFAQHPDAFNPTGHFYQYAFHFSASDPNTDKGWNAFKFRANGTTLILGKQVVGFLGGMTVPNDVSTIYPDFPNSLNGTTYNGEWTFQANLPSFLTQVTMFDGDMDFGAEDCQVYNDTDDPDSTGIPVFATGAAVAEGVAQATGNAAAAACDGLDFANGTRTGLPADDNSSPAFQRSPGIVPAGVAYQLVAPGGPKYPGGQIFLNENVSGNREWEQFRIQKVAPADFNGIRCPAGGYAADATYPASDCRTDELPGGGWQVQLRGMDLANLNFFYFDFEFQPPDPNVYSIGRLVWYDDNKNGAQDLCAGIPCAPELGIAGVAYSVFDPASATPLIPVRTGVTNATGEFLEINLPAANYTVVVDASNFGAGQPLEGLTSTTGGETEAGIEVGLPICTDPGVPAGCGDPLYAEAIFGYVRQSGGLNAPTNQTCADYADGTIEHEDVIFYQLNGTKIKSVNPGVIFFFTQVTVGVGQTLSVQQSRTGTGAGNMLLHNSEAKVFTLGCQQVNTSVAQNNGTVTFGALAPGTYILQLKWSPKSVEGTNAPNPTTINYTFVAALNGVPDPTTQNVPPLALTKK